MRRSLSIEMFEKIGGGNKTTRDSILSSRKKDMSEVPVRDRSVLERSKALSISSKGLSLKDSIIIRKI